MPDKRWRSLFSFIIFTESFDRIREIPSGMYPAVRVRDSIHRIIQDVILLETIRFTIPFELLQEFFRMLMVPAALIIVDYDRTLFVEFPGPVNPCNSCGPERFSLSSGSFGSLSWMTWQVVSSAWVTSSSFEEFFLHQPPDRVEIFLRDRTIQLAMFCRGMLTPFILNCCSIL